MEDNSKEFRMFPLGCEEKYFLSNVYSEDKLIAENVRTKIIVDKYKAQNSICYLYPSNSSEYAKLSNFFEFRIEGKLEDLIGEKIGSISITKGYNSGAKSTLLAPYWENKVIKVYPDEIFIRHKIKELKNNNEVLFVITENKLLQPYGGIERYFTGDVKVNSKPRVILNSSNGMSYIFDKYFDSIDIKIENTEGSFTYAYHVLRVENLETKLSSVEDLSPIIETIDNILLYLSFATRQRTVWIRWATIIDNELVDYIRCNIVYPQIDIEDPLIERKSLQNFLQHCLEWIEQRQSKEIDLYLPIIYLIGYRNKTAESQFLSLFIALEALLNIFAEYKEISRHLSRAQWRKFSKELNKEIEKFCFSPDPDQNSKDRELMVKKLSRLNEPSLELFYNEFCKYYSIDNSDLWPVFGKDSKISLSTIRNKLVHGKRFEYIDYLSIAIEHLQWIVERCILSVLGWKESSDVNSDKLNKYYAYHNWRPIYEHNL